MRCHLNSPLNDSGTVQLVQHHAVIFIYCGRAHCPLLGRGKLTVLNYKDKNVLSLHYVFQLATLRLFSLLFSFCPTHHFATSRSVIPVKKILNNFCTKFIKDNEKMHVRHTAGEICLSIDLRNAFIRANVSTFLEYV